MTMATEPKHDVAAQKPAEEMAENGAEAAAAEREKSVITPELRAELEALIATLAADAFAKILSDPATAAAAREAAVDAEIERDARETARAFEDAARADAAAKDALAAAKQSIATEKKKARSDYNRAVKAAMAVLGDWPEGPVRLRFADGEQFLVGHSIGVTADDFDRASGQAIYGEAVIFDPEGPSGHAAEAWLVATDPDNHVTAAVRADLGAGLRVGDGATALIPARHLAF